MKKHASIEAQGIALRQVMLKGCWLHRSYRSFFPTEKCKVMIDNSWFSHLPLHSVREYLISECILEIGSLPCLTPCSDAFSLQPGRQPCGSLRFWGSKGWHPMPSATPTASVHVLVLRKARAGLSCLIIQFQFMAFEHDMTVTLDT